MSKTLRIIAKFILACLSLVLSYWVYMNYLAQYVHYISNYGFNFETMLNLGIVALLGYFIYAFFKLLLTGHIKIETLRLLYGIYFIALFFLLFLKNIGVQGLSLNPFSFVQEIYWGSHFVPIMNLLMFIPLGLLFRPRFSNLLLSLIALFGVEAIQYFAHLGIFDLGDIVLNMLGILIGNALMQMDWVQHFKTKIITRTRP